MADDEEEDDFFGAPSPIAIGASLRETEEGMSVHNLLCREVGDTEEGELEDSRRARRKRRNFDRDFDCVDDDIELLRSTAAKKLKEGKNEDAICLFSSDEEDEDDDDLEPIPHFYPTDFETMKLLQAAEEAALNLKRPDSITVYSNNNTSHNESATSDIILHSPQQMMLTLRIRCMGKLHKITIDESDPLAVLVGRLADILNKPPDQILLQYKSNDIDTTCSPKALSISSVDILDAFVLDKSVDSSVAQVHKVSSFTIKIQTSNKSSISYIIEKDEPLEPTFCKFAAELGLSLRDLSFWFDGEKIRKNQSPEDLDMECDDVIDAKIIEKNK